MNGPQKFSSVFKFLLLPVLAVALGLGAVGLLMGQAQTARASAPVSVQAGVPVWDAASFSVGAEHVCAVTLSGGVKCWGSNNYGQLGDGTTTNRSSPVDVSGLTSGVVAVGAGDSFTCALITGGEVKCWGVNWDGQLGVSTVGDDCRGDPCSKTPVSVPGLSGVASLAVGSWHTCVLVNDEVKCWGYNGEGQLGDGTDTSSSTPVVVTDTLTGSPLSGIAAVAPGASQTCALTSSGGVKCWGENWYGQLGDGTTDAHWTPAVWPQSLPEMSTPAP
jgi:alpha-tubulin suppressor-like RCC1 family protein